MKTAQALRPGPPRRNSPHPFAGYLAGLLVCGNWADRWSRRSELGLLGSAALLLVNRRAFRPPPDQLP